MHVRHQAGFAGIDNPVALEPLRDLVETLAFPRHYVAEAKANQRAGSLVADVFADAGFDVRIDGPWRNVVALPRDVSKPLRLVGAHYDSVPGSPGADDNASAVAAMLVAARMLGPDVPVVWVGFNREEDGLLGSGEFVAEGAHRLGIQVGMAHVLEMLGFTSDHQALPPGLPIATPPDGRFLGLLSKGASNAEVKRVMAVCEAQVPQLPITALHLWLGVDRLLTDLLRSDHAPFWAAGIPAVMWTDTAEFRNPHYHRATDLPETLDYPQLARITALLAAAMV